MDKVATESDIFTQNAICLWVRLISTGSLEGRQFFLGAYHFNRILSKLGKEF